MMTITQNSVVTLRLAMFDAERKPIESASDMHTYLQGSDDLFELVQKALAGKVVGDRVEVVLAPDDGFGDVIEELVRKEPLAVLPGPVEVGMLLEADDDEGDVLVFRVVEVDADSAVLDGNHPLAGMTVIVQAEVVEIREATAAEQEAGTLFPDD